jgi:hypothetical protein
MGVIPASFVRVRATLVAKSPKSGLFGGDSFISRFGSPRAERESASD